MQKLHSKQNLCMSLRTLNDSTCNKEYEHKIKSNTKIDLCKQICMKHMIMDNVQNASKDKKTTK